MFRTLLVKAARAATTDVPILLRGESGTGKNVLARWIWQHGSRVRGPFVSVNCPALSVELMNSTLFGHRRGAFTGATSDAIGKVQEAEGGTLFLDEVGDLSSEAQARLLRFLNDRTYERVGEPIERRANVRLIAATNRRLEDEGFREDLLFRLDVVTFVMPPLRERVEDLRGLCAHYLRAAAMRLKRPAFALSPAAERAVIAYHWPGNLRELHNAIERAMILASGPMIEPEDLGIPRAAPDTPTQVLLGSDVSIEAIEREHIARVIARASTLELAARILEIDASTLQRKRKRYGLL
ncbi:MAG: sigma-54 dependent transcriptional regulator [Kofleriaceae bacterium]